MDSQPKWPVKCVHVIKPSWNHWAYCMGVFYATCSCNHFGHDSSIDTHSSLQWDHSGSAPLFPEALFVMNNTLNTKQDLFILVYTSIYLMKHAFLTCQPVKMLLIILAKLTIISLTTARRCTWPTWKPQMMSQDVTTMKWQLIDGSFDRFICVSTQTSCKK